VQIVIEHNGAQREVDLLIEGPGTNVADLVRAVNGGAPEAGIVIEDRFFGLDTGLDEVGLYEGALVRITSVPTASVRGTPEAPGSEALRIGPVLAIGDGPVAGAMAPLDGQEVLIGRGEDCDVRLDDETLSLKHARLSREDGAFVISDLWSCNGTWVDHTAISDPVVVKPGALLRMGATHARVLADVPDDRPLAADPLLRAIGGLVPFNRPPRPALPEEPQPFAAPEPPKQSGRARALSIISIVAPLVMGLLLFLLMRDVRYALFVLLSPVMAVGSWLAARRSTREEERTHHRAFRKALDALDQDLAQCVAWETARREQLLPDAAETLRRARTPSIRLWERRPEHPDFLHLRAGIGCVPWSPPVTAGRDGLPAQVEEVVAHHRTLQDAPVQVDLSHGGVVGLVGDRTAALALARSLVCQAAVHHGPADVSMVIVTSQAHASEWDWAKWLPHVRDESGTTRLLSSDRATSDALLGDLAGAHRDAGPQLQSDTRDGVAMERTRLLVLDDICLIEGRRAPARLLLRGAAGPSAGIVIAETADQLPAVTTTVIELRTNLGDADLRRPQERVCIDDFVICGITEDAARQAARALARYEDPELAVVGAGLPQLVRLLPLLGMDPPDADAVLRAWKTELPDPGPNGPIGVSEDGVVHLNLVQDGPHGLIGGTTGSGKSELLRCMVAGMAARVDPDHLVFVLIDYKGGSAFDECARLPHTVGMVTDLDEHLGERALTSLEAELAYRERLLRAAGASGLPEYLRMGAPLGPLPRLVVVIDEFATVAAELPDFISALVGVAQRGRSLGVHLILATQRPSGAVNANIKANANLRIALRVQDTGDSTDIIASADAATISRSNPGRAYIRRGAGDVVLAQTPLSTAAISEQRASGIRLEPFRFGPVPSTPGTSGAADHEGPTDLARLVDAVREAFARSGMAPPRTPWLAMLAERVELETILADSKAADVVAFALADDPEHQQQIPVGWDPRKGHLALFGMVGSGTTTAMLAVAHALVWQHAPDECHLYAIDFGAGGLAPLASLPHVGAVIAANDFEAQFRLLRYLRREVDRRRSLDPEVRRGEPRLVVLIDGIDSFLAEHDDIERAETAEAFRRVFSDGPTVDVLFVLSGDRPGALPVRLSSLVSEKILFRLADPSDFSAIGVRTKELPRFVPGRGIHGESKLVLQVGHPGNLHALGDALNAGGLESAPPRLGALPAQLRFEHLPGGATLTPSKVELTLGIADEDLGPAMLTMRGNDHALIAGPPQCGKTSTLMLIASLVRAADPYTVLVGVCDERSPLYGLQALDAAGTLEQLAHIVQAAPGDERSWLILVDDACRVDDVHGVMMAAVRCGRPGLRVIAADRADEFHAGWGNWTRVIRQSRTGVLLQPALANDGALLSVRLPRRLPIPLVPGRGFVVSAGELILAQIALPPAI
jgi:S-DNA-T family DNA segregation ATPase FtsK/SpoIIIE